MYLCSKRPLQSSHIVYLIQFRIFLQSSVNGPYFSCDPQTTLLATGDTVRFEWYSPELEWNSHNAETLEDENDEEAEVTWSYTMNQTNNIDKPANMENGISCGESTPAGTCNIYM